MSQFRVVLPADPQAGARTVYAEVTNALGEGLQHILVDCSEWQRLDLRLLSDLVRCARACEQAGAEFELANVHHHLRAEIHELRLDRRLRLEA